MLNAANSSFKQSLKSLITEFKTIYISNSTKNQKDKPCKKDLPLLKNDITNNLEPQKPVIYSRYMKSGLSAYTLEISQKFKPVRFM